MNQTEILKKCFSFMDLTTLHPEDTPEDVTKLVDKVTGKEAKRQDQLQQNEKVSAQADSDVAKLKQSIAEAQSMLDDVDAKLDTVSEMQQEASRIKAKAESAYAERDNDYAKEVISDVKYYLHKKQIDVIDYNGENKALFERMPGEKGTIRPALVIANTVIRKGLAAGE